MQFLRSLIERPQAPFSWVEKEFAFSLWFGFLTISPSYELATRYEIDGLTKFERTLLPPDFDRVLAVYEDLGPVRGIDFIQWWPKARASSFGNPGWRPDIMHLGTLSSESELQAIEQKIAWMKALGRDMVAQNSAVLAVPLDWPKRKLMRQFSDLLDELQPKVQKPQAIAPKYQLARKRQDNKSLLGYLDLFWKRAAIVKPLWRVGYEAGFSSTYTRAISAALEAGREPDADQKERLKILTSRGLARAWMIAENAARGVFPSYEKCPGAVPIQQLGMYEVVRDQNRAAQLSEWLRLYPTLFAEE